ncbi:MAG: PASTA domain-containing protein [Oligoflexia bacterium]|nr:PASTA domain-containing protein [Oligoflexia bacterium]
MTRNQEHQENQEHEKKYKKKKLSIKDKDKIGLAFILFVFLFILIVSKAFYIQIVANKKLTGYAKNQLLREDIVYPKRGNIYDRNSNPLAINVHTYSIFTVPKADDLNQNENYKKLSKIIPTLNLNEIKKKTANRNRYTWIIRKIKLTAAQLDKISELENIFVSPEPSRFYPNNELLSQTLGFVGIDNVGLSGVEFKFDKELRGDAKITKYLKDAKGRPIKFEMTKTENDASDIYLSIEKDLQALVEKVLKESVIKNNASKGGIGIMNSETGEILAMANYPTFDPNNPKEGNIEHQKLPFISDPIEPGSILKTLTVISALENKIATPTSSYYCERGQMRVEDHTINEAESHEKFEWLTVNEIIQHSSNVGIIKIAFDVTFPFLKRTLKKFNFGEKTGIEIPGESRGIFVNKENVSPLTLSNISFGQGIAVTGIQILTAYSVIANGGKLVRPTILKINDPSKIKPEQIIPPDVAKNVSKMLQLAVEKGTGTNAQLAHFQIAGKTATAQKPDPKGGYDGYLSGFVGFPLNVDIDKKFVLFVYIDNPKNGQYYGNAVAAPIFTEVARYMLYENKNPGNNKNPNNNKIINSNTSNLAYEALKEKYKDKNSKAKSNNGNNGNDGINGINGVNGINNSNSNNTENDIQNRRIIGQNKVPNFIGLDKLSALKLAQKTKITIENHGMGLVTSQTPHPGAAINSNGKSLIELNYESPRYD